MRLCLAIAIIVVSYGELVCLLVILVQIGQDFAIAWRAMKVELGVIL